jgi:hypothetical protein
MQQNLALASNSTQLRSIFPVRWLFSRDRAKETVPPAVPEQPAWHARARERGLEPVFADWTNCYAVDAQGRAFYAEDDRWTEVREIDHRRLRHVVLAQAAMTLPAFDHAMPVRHASDPTCESCGGDTNGLERNGIICWCGGTGWIPFGVPQARNAVYASEHTWIEDDPLRAAG